MTVLSLVSRVVKKDIISAKVIMFECIMSRWAAPGQAVLLRSAPEVVHGHSLDIRGHLDHVGIHHQIRETCARLREVWFLISAVLELHATQWPNDQINATVIWEQKCVTKVHIVMKMLTKEHLHIVLIDFFHELHCSKISSKSVQDTIWVYDLFLRLTRFLLYLQVQYHSY